MGTPWGGPMWSCGDDPVGDPPDSPDCLDERVA